MPTLLERYLSGEYRKVWAEMVAGADNTGQPIDSGQAEAVGAETMRRMRRNIETVIERLTEFGYTFGYYPDGETEIPYYPGPLSPPTAQVGRHIAELEAATGPMPLSLKAFWSEVGGVNFAGALPAWGDKNFDPLWVDSVEKGSDTPNGAWHLLECSDWRENVEEYGAEEVGPFILSLAPDDLNKANVSGGAPYGMTLPNVAADAPFENEWHQVTFVEYLRIALLDWGGFPGFTPDSERGNSLGAIPAEIEFLKAELEPF